MLIKKEILNQLCPLYQKEIEILEKHYVQIPENNHGLKKECLFKFSQNYLMIKELWNIFFEESKKEQAEASFGPNGSQLVQSFLNDKKRSRYHFYISDGNDGFIKLWQTTPIFNKSFFLDSNAIQLHLSLPRKGLEQTWKYFDEYSCKPLPVEAHTLYKETKELYSQILAAENCDKKWFDLIIQVKDIEYVENNIEWKIGQNLNNQYLWKLYLKYLENNDTKRLLYLYSCYCRFFISDVETRTEYKKAVQKYGPSGVTWINLFEFEFNEGKILDRNTYPTYSEYQPRINNILIFSAANCFTQNFSLSKTLMLYIKENANPRILHQLHKCCKYFFITFSHPVYHMLQICENSNPQTDDIPQNYVEFYQQSACIRVAWYKQVDLCFDHRFIVSNSFKVGITTRDTLIKVIPYIFHCSAKYIQIGCQDITYKDFTFLSGHGNVVKLYLSDTNIVNDKNEHVELQDILKFTPNIVDLQMKTPTTSQQTFKELYQLNFKKKFKSFELNGLKNCEAYAMAEFLKKNLNSNSKFVTHFDKNVEQSVVNDCYHVLKKELTGYWPAFEEPNIEVNQAPGIRRSVFVSSLTQ